MTGGREMAIRHPYDPSFPSRLPPDLPAHFFSSLFKTSQEVLDFGDNREDDTAWTPRLQRARGLRRSGGQSQRPAGGPASLLAFKPIDSATRKKGKVLSSFVLRSLPAISIPWLGEPIVINVNYWLGYIRFPKMEPFTANH